MSSEIKITPLDFDQLIADAKRLLTELDVGVTDARVTVAFKHLASVEHRGRITGTDDCMALVKQELADKFSKITGAKSDDGK